MLGRTDTLDTRQHIPLSGLHTINCRSFRKKQRKSDENAVSGHEPEHTRFDVPDIGFIKLDKSDLPLGDGWGRGGEAWHVGRPR